METSNLDIKINIKRNGEQIEICLSQELYNSKFTLGIQTDAITNTISGLIKNTIVELSEDLLNDNEIVDF